MVAPMCCQVRVRGHLSAQWADWFSGLQIENRPEGVAILRGRLPDQALLLGVLNRMHELGLELISVEGYADREGAKARPVPYH